MINTKLKLTAFSLLPLHFLLVLTQICDDHDAKTTSPSHFSCDQTQNQQQICKTYAVLRANSHYSSMSNLAAHLNILHSKLSEANGFSKDIELFSGDQPVLIPIDCKCNGGGFFEAEIEITAAKDESLFQVAESLEGLTTCNAIKAKNPSFRPSNRAEKSNLLVPLNCACPFKDVDYHLVSYPVKRGDTLSELALEFNVSEETIISANNKHSKPEDDSFLLQPFSTLLIPFEKNNPVFGFLQKPHEPNLGRNSIIHVEKISNRRKKKKHKMKMIGVYIAIAIVALLACVAIFAAIFFIHMKNRKNELEPIKFDLETQRLGLSIRTTSDKKISFEGSQYNLDDNHATTPHRAPLESYAFEDLERATEGFSSSYLIEGSVFHGRVKGKNLAIKRVPTDVLSRVDYNLFDERPHRHPNVIRLLGTCPIDNGPDSFFVFEYAKNGSLKDWIHGGLAIKSHFIESCSCFLTWSQRLRICLDVATALQYMHHVMSPCYVHRNVRSRNVFLDEDFSAKIGNFGLARCIGHEADDQESNKGYLAPEYVTQGAVSPSVDVFAYGVVLLEVLSGKPAMRRNGDDDQEKMGEFIKLSDEIKRILQSDDGEGLKGWIDGALGENYSFDAAFTLANIAKSCVDDDVSLRPNAGEIVEKLLRLVEELPEADRFSSVCESSCKPLVKAAAKEF